MTKKGKIWAVILIVLGLIALSVVGVYNSLVRAEVNVDEKWAQVETVYQRRADLVPQLVATTEGAADFEKTTLENVTNARTQWLGAGSLDAKMDAAKNLDSSLAALLATFENYPNLTATANFKTLQDQLEGNENRIAVERKRFNEAVAEFNKMIKVFPKNLVAGLFGFENREFFEALEGAETAPEVEFNFE